MTPSRSQRAGLAGALALAVACGCDQPHPGGAREGRTSDAAAPHVDALRSADAGDRSLAAFKLAQLPAEPAIIRALRDALDDRDTYVRRNAACGLWVHARSARDALPDITEALRDEDFEVRMWAVRALGAMGESARPAVLDLAKLVQGEDVGIATFALGALGQIGPSAHEAIPAIEGALLHDDAGVRLAALEPLHLVAARSRPVKCPLVRALADTSRDVRWQAAAILFDAPPHAGVHDAPCADPGVDARISTLIVAHAQGAATHEDLARGLADDDPRVRLVAARAFFEVVERSGPEADVSMLVAPLRHSDRDVRWCMATALVSTARSDPKSVLPALLVALEDADSEVGVVAAAALGGLRQDGAEAVPALARAIRLDPNLREASFMALASIGDAAVPALLDLLESRSEAVHDRAVDVLAVRLLPHGEDPPTAPVVVSPSLRAALRDEKFVQRALSAKAFGGWTSISAGAAAGETLARLAVDPTLYHWQRAEALEALGALGDAAAHVAPRLALALDEGHEQRELLVRALGRMGAGAHDAAASLQRAARDPDPSLRREALVALSAIGPEAEAWPLLRAALDDVNPAVRMEAAERLLRAGREEPGAEAVVAGMIADGDWSTRAEGLAAAARLGPAAISVLPRIVEALEDERGELRQRALEAVAAMGPSAAPALPRVLILLDDSEPAVRQAAIRTVERLAPAVAVAQVARRLDDPVAWVRSEAVAALARLHATAPEAVPALARAVEHESEQVRADAVRALGSLGPGAKGAIPALTRALADDEESVRVAAAEALRAASGP